MSELQQLTVREYAKLQGISVQSVYKQINKGKLKKVEKVESGKTITFIEVEDDFAAERLKTISTNSTERLKTNSTDFLQDEISYLRSKLDEKEERIKELTDTITALSQRIADITEQNNLIAIQTVQKLAEATETDTATTENAVEVKQNFFSRLFKHK